MSSPPTRTARATIIAVIARIGRTRWLPAALLVFIGMLDLVNAATPFSVLLTGLLDEPAHLATAALALLAIAGSDRLTRHPYLTTAALAASMLIDVDHVPLYAGVPHVAATGGRPFSHSLTTVLILALIWLVTGRRRPVLAGAAAGVCLHFVRDIATGPGLPLFWPMSSETARLPYAAYVAVLVAFTLAATLRARAAHRTRPQPLQ